MSNLIQDCLSLSPPEKVELIQALLQSIDTPIGRKFENLHNAIVAAVGVEVLTDSRIRRAVIGRTILAYACAKEGWSEHTIGQYLNRDHSTINGLKQNMRYWLSKPNLFNEENRMYVEFINKLNHETNR